MSDCVKIMTYEEAKTLNKTKPKVRIVLYSYKNADILFSAHDAFLE